jgi:hypothetical protein
MTKRLLGINGSIRGPEGNAGELLEIAARGKPVCVVVTADSVGGSDVAERLLGVFSTHASFVPPLTGKARVS